MIRVATLFLSLIVGCAAPQVRERSPFSAPDPDRSTPTERLGYRIYQLDQAAWHATDAAARSGLQSTPVEGWLVVPRGAGFLVRFIGACADNPCSHIDIHLSTSGVAPVVEALNPPIALPREHAAMWHARQLASASGFKACTPNYNTVVIPVEEQPGLAWRVYLLAASPDSDQIILTGHHRITVSSDGRTILESEALSKSCIVNKAEPGRPLAGLFVTHVLHPEPIETHVFTSLNYQLPLYVGTERGTFKVDGASIELVEPR